MFCLYCGNTLPDEVLFCNTCGKQQKAPTNAPMPGSGMLPTPSLPNVPLIAGQPFQGHIPTIQGAPQISGIPSVPGTPFTPRHAPAGNAASSLHPSPGSSGLSQAPSPNSHIDLPQRHEGHYEPDRHRRMPLIRSRNESNDRILRRNHLPLKSDIRGITSRIKCSRRG
jgi:hypothetical protein